MTTTPASGSVRFTPPWPLLAFAAAVLGLLAIFPPFRFARLGADGKPQRTAETMAPYDPATFAANFWTNQLLPAEATAPELAPLLVALRADPDAARRHLGRQVGAGTTWYFFARGSGRIAAIERNRVVVTVDGTPGLTVALRTGPVFGNVVRDGCGLLELNRVPGLAEFNALSTELNRRVEETVQPALKSGVAAGMHVRFAGCAEAPERVAEGPLLLIIPVVAQTSP